MYQFEFWKRYSVKIYQKFKDCFGKHKCDKARWNNFRQDIMFFFVLSWILISSTMNWICIEFKRLLRLQWKNFENDWLTLDDQDFNEVMAQKMHLKNWPFNFSHVLHIPMDKPFSPGVTPNWGPWEVTIGGDDPKFKSSSTFCFGGTEAGVEVREVFFSSFWGFEVEGDPAGFSEEEAELGGAGMQLEPLLLLFVFTLPPDIDAIYLLMSTWRKNVSIFFVTNRHTKTCTSNWRSIIEIERSESRSKSTNIASPGNANQMPKVKRKTQKSFQKNDYKNK